MLHRLGPRAPGYFSRFRTMTAVTLGFLAASCSPAEALKPVFPVRGQVFFDGKPAAGMLVVFRPVGDPVPNALDPRAVVDDAGNFVLSTHNAHDGAPPGKYAVTIHSLKAASVETGGPPSAAGGDRFPARYASPATSGLEVQILAGTNTIPPFRLTR